MHAFALALARPAAAVAAAAAASRSAAVATSRPLLASVVAQRRTLATQQQLPQTHAQPSFPAATQLNVSHLIAANTHVGHAPSRWTPHNLAYLLGTRQGLHIIDPNQTLAHLRRAAAFARLVAANGGIVLFVASDPNLHHLAVEAAAHSASFYVTHWVPGTLTNAQQVVVKRQASTDVDKQLPTLAPKPDLVVAIDLTHKHTLRAVKEARKLNIPTLAVVDTDVDPRWVTYPVPANDDSVSSLELISRTLAQAVKQGRQEAAALSRTSLNQQQLDDAKRSNGHHEPWTDLRMQDFSDV